MKREFERMEKRKQKHVYVMDGKIYFSRMVERTFYLVLTMGVLIWGLLSKLEMVN